MPRLASAMTREAAEAATLGLSWLAEQSERERLSRRSVLDGEDELASLRAS